MGYCHSNPNIQGRFEKPFCCCFCTKDRGLEYVLFSTVIDLIMMDHFYTFSSFSIVKCGGRWKMFQRDEGFVLNNICSGSLSIKWNRFAEVL